jgi:hypothetical protein
MSDWLFFGAGFVGLIYGFTHAALMFLSPGTHRRFSYWTRHRLRFGRSNSNPMVDNRGQRGLVLRYRLTGLTLLVMSCWFAWNFLLAFTHRMGTASPVVASTNTLPARIGGNWVSYAASLGAFLAGLYFLLYPEATYLWSIRNLPIRQEIRESNRSSILRGMRVMGIVLLAAIMDLLWVAVRCSSHGCK